MTPGIHMRIENIGSHPAVEDPHAQGALEYEILFQRLVFVHALIVNQGGRGEGVFPHLSQKQYQPFWATHVRSTLHTVIYIYMYIRPVTMRLYGSG